MRTRVTKRSERGVQHPSYENLWLHPRVQAIRLSSTRRISGLTTKLTRCECHQQYVEPAPSSVPVHDAVSLPLLGIQHHQGVCPGGVGQHLPPGGRTRALGEDEDGRSKGEGDIARRDGRVYRQWGFIPPKVLSIQTPAPGGLGEGLRTREADRPVVGSSSRTFAVSEVGPPTADWQIQQEMLIPV